MSRRLQAALISGLLVLGLSGCVAGRYEKAWQQASEISRECRAKRLAGELPGHVASALCSNDRMRQVLVESRYPHMDLVNLWLAYRMALAKRVDEAQLSQEDAELQHAEFIARLNNEVRRREAMALQAESQWLQGYGAMLQGLGVWSQSFTPPAQPAPMIRTPITCYRFGSMIQCY